MERFFGINRQFQGGVLTVGQARKAAMERILGTKILEVCRMPKSPCPTMVNSPMVMVPGEFTVHPLHLSRYSALGAPAHLSSGKQDTVCV